MTDLANTGDDLSASWADQARRAQRLVQVESEMLALTRQCQDAENRATQSRRERSREQHALEMQLAELGVLLDKALGIASPLIAPVSVHDLKIKVQQLSERLESAQPSNLPSLLESELSAERVAHEETRERLTERYKEIAVLTRMVRLGEHQVCQEKDKGDWLRLVASYLWRQKWWSRLLPENQWRKSLEEKLMRKNIFDAESYLALYPDVRASGIPPLLHYILHGLEEGRARE